MKSIFDKTTKEELVHRINALPEDSKAQWGKMNIYQMLKHCILCEEMYLGKTKYKRAFISYLFGKMALKNVLKDEKPLGRNTPTLPEIKMTENFITDIKTEKSKWITLIGEYDQFSNVDFVHPFFGKVTPEQIGYMAYKHIDHHLRQFNG